MPYKREMARVGPKNVWQMLLPISWTLMLLKRLDRNMGAQRDLGRFIVKRKLLIFHHMCIYTDKLSRLRPRFRLLSGYFVAGVWFGVATRSARQVRQTRVDVCC